MQAPSSDLEQFIRKHPLCCYCGGLRRTQEREHVPPKLLFFDKRRPPGQLIVPACSICNRSFSQTDQIVALFARATRSIAGPGLDHARIRKMVRAIANRHPALISEWGRLPLKTTQRLSAAEYALGTSLKAFNLGPLSQRHFQAFGARLAFGLHYHETNSIVPKSGGAVVFLKTCLNFVNGWRLPDELNELLCHPKTLGRTLKDSVGGQFLFRGSAQDDITVYFAAFGIDFAYLMFVAEDRAHLQSQHGAHVHTPGNFFSYPVPMTSGPLRWEQ